MRSFQVSSPSWVMDSSASTWSMMCDDMQRVLPTREAHTSIYLMSIFFFTMAPLQTAQVTDLYSLPPPEVRLISLVIRSSRGPNRETEWLKASVFSHGNNLHWHGYPVATGHRQNKTLLLCRIFQEPTDNLPVAKGKGQIAFWIRFILHTP